MHVWLSCFSIYCYVDQLTCGCGRECATLRISVSTTARRFLCTQVVIYKVKSEVCFLFSFQEQKYIVVCLVHQLIFIQYGRKLMPLQEAPILRSLFLLINVEAFQHIRATKVVIRRCLFRISATLAANHTNFKCITFAVSLSVRNKKSDSRSIHSNLLRWPRKLRVSIV